MPQNPPSALPLVGIIMGSRSDWETMAHAARTLDSLGVAYETRVRVSAHRTPDLLFEYAGAAAGRGIRVIIAGAGGAAHLPGMVSAKTRLPVLGVPVQSKALSGMDSLLSIVQMLAGTRWAPWPSAQRRRHQRGAAGLLHPGAAAMPELASAGSIISAPTRPAHVLEHSRSQRPYLTIPLLVKIGILGAGQLGRMLALAGYPLGFEFAFLDPAEEACAAPLGERTCAPTTWIRTRWRSSAPASTSATFEFENAPQQAAEFVAARVPPFPGAARADRRPGLASARSRCSSCSSIPVPKFAAVSSRVSGLETAAQRHRPARRCWKTARHGQDAEEQGPVRAAQRR